MAEPKYQHTEAELRYVADVLAVLNRKPDRCDAGVGGKLEMYWCDEVMGIIGLDDSQDLQSWVYYPLASAIATSEAFETPKKAIGDDPNYAWSWHIAMAVALGVGSGFCINLVVWLVYLKYLRSG